MSDIFTHVLNFGPSNKFHTININNNHPHITKTIEGIARLYLILEKVISKKTVVRNHYIVFNFNPPRQIRDYNMPNTNQQFY